jgi:CBS domain containing-hemolysin-like protein
MTRPGWREVLVEIVAITAFPRLAPTAWARRGPRAVVAWIVFLTAVGFAQRTWFVPWRERVTDVREELRRQFGREPTDTEVMQRVRAAYGR